MSLSITQKDLNLFLGEINSLLPLYAPTLDKDETFSRYRFRKIKNISEISLNYGHTVIPPKKYLFPARSELLKFEKGEILPPKNKESIVIMNKRDGEGIFYLDEIMSKPIPDEEYLARRDFVKIIIVDIKPPSNALNCDLYLQRVDESHYIATPFSNFGEKLVDNKYFGHDKNISTISARNLPDEIIFHPRLDEIIEKSRDNKIWDRLAEKCFNCGICSYVCPLCYCFEVEDKVAITANINEDMAGIREKRWDSCMLPEFATVSFKNFRPEPKERIYNWYYHKFVRMPRELGFPGCVDCGRCMYFCPAKIKYREVLRELIENEK